MRINTTMVPILSRAPSDRHFSTTSQRPTPTFKISTWPQNKFCATSNQILRFTSNTTSWWPACRHLGILNWLLSFPWSKKGRPGSCSIILFCLNGKRRRAFADNAPEPGPSALLPIASRGLRQVLAGLGCAGQYINIGFGFRASKDHLRSNRA